MKTKSKIALLIAGIAVTGTASAYAYADNGMRGMFRHGQEQGQDFGRMGRGQSGDRMFQRADTDNSDTVTYEEFAAFVAPQLEDADADGNGKISSDELAASIERQMAKRRAERMIERFDTDNDGQISQDEIDAHQKKLFARADIDNSGVIERDELPAPDQGRGMGRGGDGPRMQHDGDGSRWRHGGSDRF